MSACESVLPLLLQGRGFIPFALAVKTHFLDKKENKKPDCVVHTVQVWAEEIFEHHTM